MLGRKLDRYVVGQFLRYYLYALLAFIVIYLVVNFIESVSRFMARGTDVGIIAEYYLLMVPFVIKWINPIAVLLGVLFCISVLSKGSEITAMKAGGISLLRVFTPLIVMGALIAALVWVWGEVVVPPANEEMVNIQKWVFDHKDKEARMKTNDYSANLQNGNLLYAGVLDAYNGKMSRPSLLVFSDDDADEASVEQRIDAVAAEYIDDEWHFFDCEVRTFGPDGLETALDQIDEMTVPIVESPTEFGILAKTPEDMTYQELYEHIQRLERAGKETNEERVELELKISVALANLVVVLLGAPLAIRTARSGTALGFGVAVLLGFVLWGFIAMGRALGQSGVITPFWAAYLPNILFAAVGLVLIWRVNRT
jgi:lipopolysaccharide export system permease protein